MSDSFSPNLSPPGLTSGSQTAVTTPFIVPSSQSLFTQQQLLVPLIMKEGLKFVLKF